MADEPLLFLLEPFFFFSSVGLCVYGSMSWTASTLLFVHFYFGHVRWTMKTWFYILLQGVIQMSRRKATNNFFKSRQRVYPRLFSGSLKLMGYGRERYNAKARGSTPGKHRKKGKPNIPQDQGNDSNSLLLLPKSYQAKEKERHERIRHEVCGSLICFRHYE